MTTFAYELASVLQHIAAARPESPDRLYALPWYLVIGEPGSGRSTAIKALSLRWPHGDGPLPLSTPDPWCSYWLPEKVLFIEPEARVLGPSRDPGKLEELCDELCVKRPREPIDGMVLLVNARYLADSGEDGVEGYAKTLRRYLIEVAQALGADVPVYVVVTAIDDLWGFGDAFRWGAERRDEEPWGFSLPPNLGQTETPDRVRAELEGLTARIEATCFARLSTEEPSDMRTRAFQHLIEVRDLLAKLGVFMHIITMSNAFERSPWVRALALGSGTPGTGHRLRHNMSTFASMGLTVPHHSGTPQPGGMPLHALIDNVLLPERDLVPTRIRWRDDKLFLVLVLLAVLMIIAEIVLYFVI
jgi:type VI secretion system protein ImpL